MNSEWVIDYPSIRNTSMMNRVINNSIVFSSADSKIVLINNFFRFTDSPTPGPTPTPSQAPSRIPTKIPTKIPSRIPTRIPSRIPTVTPTETPTSTTSAATVKATKANVTNSNPGDSTDDVHDLSREQIDSLQRLSSYLAIVLIILTILIVSLRICYFRCTMGGKTNRFKGSDAPNYEYVSWYINSVCDFWSDIMFCYLAYLVNEIVIFYFALIFTLIPLLMSFVLSIYWIHKWRTMTCSVPHRIIHYLRANSVKLITFTIFSSDFYCSVLLLQSKLFCLDIFNFSLTKDETSKLIIWKLISVVICENIPHLVLQYCFIFNRNTDDGSTVVLISLILTSLSLLSSTGYFLVQLINYLIQYNKHVMQITTYEVKMKLTCDEFKKCHGCIQDKMELAIWNTLSKGRDQRSDVRMNIDVFYIDNSQLCPKKNSGIQKSISVFFKIELACYNDNDKNNRIRDKLHENIQNFSDGKTKIGESLVNWIETLVYCQSVKVDSNDSDNSKNFDIYRFETLDLITNSVLLQIAGKKAVKVVQFTDKYLPRSTQTFVWGFDTSQAIGDTATQELSEIVNRNGARTVETQTATPGADTKGIDDIDIAGANEGGNQDRLEMEMEIKTVTTDNVSRQGEADHETHESSAIVPNQPGAATNTSV